MLPGVFQCLPQLLEPEHLIPFAFQVQVIGHEFLAVYQRFGDQSDSSAEPPLKDFRLRHIPTRLPEIGLSLEANDASVREGPGGKSRHAMKRG